MKSLILVDANGTYRDGRHQHYSYVTDAFYEKIVKKIRSGEYSTILYLPNTPNIKTLYEWEKALATDPILTRLSKNEKSLLTIFPHGFQNQLEDLESIKNMVNLENNLAKTTSIVVGGLYRDWCVKSHYDAIKSRNPDADISISHELSLESLDALSSKSKPMIF